MELDLQNTIFPDDAGKVFLLESVSEVADELWRKEACPEWINISVFGADKNRTLILLECCGRFQRDEARLYYHKWGTQPFGIKGPMQHFWQNSEAKRGLPSIKAAIKAKKSSQEPYTFMDGLRSRLYRWLFHFKKN